MNTNHVYKLILGSVLLGSIAGCTSSRLEPRPMTETENFWAQNLHKWYPAWRPPYLAPAQKAVAPGAMQSGGQEATPAPATPPQGPAAVEAPVVAPEAGEPQAGVELVPVSEQHEQVTARRAAGKAAGKQAVLKAKTYTVQAGDTLERIARKFYGKTSAWKHILESNRNILSSPSKLRAGMVLRITALP